MLRLSFRFVTVCALLFMTAGLLSTSALSQEQTKPELKFRFTPEKLQANVGDKLDLKVELIDKDGAVQSTQFFVFARGRDARRSVEVNPRRSDSTGVLNAIVTAHRPGSFRLMAISATSPEERVTGMTMIDIAYPELEKITFINPKTKVYANTHGEYALKVTDVAGLVRDEVKVALTSSNPDVVSINDYGHFRAHKAGSTTIAATAEGVETRLQVEVADNPVASLELHSEMTEARTGDVFHFQTTARNALGQIVADAPVYYSFHGKPFDEKEPEVSGEIEQNGRFVANTPGFYTVIASSGPQKDEVIVRITQREVQQKIEIVGHAPVLKVRTSDLWVWEGIDGRDYAVTGTWNADGEAYFWDVTDPSNITPTDTIKVDARTVNDVKISEDGRVCVISREGASNRKNGIVILDVSNPRDVKIISRYDDELTGGVHNVFVYDNHVYAVNNGRRYDIINIEDPANPQRVGRFELDTPGHAVHDVWVVDGIAYSSNWSDGVQLVDIGGATAGGPFRGFGKKPDTELAQAMLKGGSPSNPIQFASYEYPSGWNHAAFPFRNEKTNKFYVIAGDEASPAVSPYGEGFRDQIPGVMAGWLHFVDFTDPKNPREVARYKVPEAGSHNYWVEDDILYVAFYNGGLRVVDVSGELMGDLYLQGREIARLLPTHPQGHTPNSPMVWGPQPHKGVIFFSDMNSGLWAARLVPKDQPSGGTE
ncbi:MAG: hypothetical protein H6695_08130 [Deferribacteres bacterium]|nr:hypothetical protein [candidate division KSB1 bacterium]MCB9510135.1 hypothetical protein [Deferribacteres bacterium]